MAVLPGKGVAVDDEQIGPESLASLEKAFVLLREKHAVTALRREKELVHVPGEGRLIDDQDVSKDARWHGWAKYNGFCRDGKS
jgi:hypothetical protein